MAPLAWVGGWRAVFLLGLLSVSFTVLFTAQWIAESGGSPLYALTVLGYVPALVMARVAMSDLPSACLVAIGLWMFWREGEHKVWWRLFAGFVGGASLCLREPNALLFEFFFVGVVLRRERGAWASVLGGLAGIGWRFVGSLLMFGDPMFAIPHPGFTGAFASSNIILYLFPL